MSNFYNPDKLPLNRCEVRAIERADGQVRVAISFGSEEYWLPEESAAALGATIVNVVMELRRKRGETGNVL